MADKVLDTSLEAPIDPARTRLDDDGRVRFFGHHCGLLASIGAGSDDTYYTLWIWTGVDQYWYTTVYLDPFGTVLNGPTTHPANVAILFDLAIDAGLTLEPSPPRSGVRKGGPVRRGPMRRHPYRKDL